MKPCIGGYDASHIDVVCAFDVDKRKVGKTLKEALLAKPNCTPVMCDDLEDGPTVLMGHTLDGIASCMKKYPEHQAFRECTDREPVDVAKTLEENGVDILSGIRGR